MRSLKKGVILILFLIYSNSYGLEIYSHTDDQGNVSYSDQPQGEAAEVITIKNENTSFSKEEKPVSEKPIPQELPYSPPKPDENKSALELAKSMMSLKKPYVSFTMIYPANEETIQNQAELRVEVKTEPALQQGDKVQIYLDDAPLGEMKAATSFQFTAPPRGTHTLFARLFDEKNRLLKQTPLITIYVHQAHVGSPGFQQRIP